MRAQSYDRYGDDSVLTLGDLPMPKVGPGEVLVKVRAASVNPVDWKLMSGGLDAMMETYFPVVPGWDVAGTVEKLGIDVPEFAVGDEVYAYARKDFVHGGTFAEYVTVPVRALARKPRSLSWSEAGGVPLAGLTAYQSLVRLGVEDGSTVLIHNAAGGVGTFAVQIAKALGARVIATASERNHEHLRELGADETLTYGSGLTERVRDVAPEGVDVVLDLVGGVLDVTTAVLAEGGRHGSIADPGVLEHGGIWIWVRPSTDDLTALAELADAGKIRVPIAAEFNLDDLPDAFALSREGHARGKIIVTVA